MKTVKQAFQEGCEILSKAHMETPILDATVLLAYCLGVTKERLFILFPEHLKREIYMQFMEAVEKRLKNIPVSYIVQKKEFFGIEFYVDERVLVPRPDTEIIVETAINIAKNDDTVTKIHDSCTGSGCISISMKYYQKSLDISASDLSADAGEVFKKNSWQILGKILPFYQSYLMRSVPGTFDMIVANPPYITDAEYAAMKAAGWPEPEIALRGGKTGLDIAYELIDQALDSLRPRGYLLLEASPAQISAIGEKMIARGFRDTEVVKDLGGRNRGILGRREA